MKTPEELTALKAEVAALNAKLAALSDDELAQVAGGTDQTPLAEVTRLLSEAQTTIDSIAISGKDSDFRTLRYSVKQARDALSQGDLHQLSQTLQYILRITNKLDLYILASFADLISQALALL